MRRWPPVSLRACLELLRFRVRLPRMLEAEPLDALVEGLGSWRPKRNARRPGPTRAELDASIKATEAVISRLRLVPDTCLYRSMGRYALLRGYGIDAVFCMGVKQGAERGHAWVEDEAGPYREAIEDGEYAVTFYHPTGAAEPPQPVPWSPRRAEQARRVVDPLGGRDRARPLFPARLGRAATAPASGHET